METKNIMLFPIDYAQNQQKMRKKAKLSKKLRKCKNLILKTITTLAVIGVICSMSMVESGEFTPAIILSMICFAWIGLFMYANQERFDS